MKQEIAAVPEIAIGHVAGRGRGVGLFHERLDRAHGRAIELLAGADVAVIRRRMGGLDAEGDDAALGCGRCCAPAGLAEFLRLAHDVIGGEHQHQRVAIALASRARRRPRPPGPESRRIGSSTMSASMPRSRNCSATTKRKSALVMTIGRANRLGIGNTRQHLLEGRSLSDQGDELLGHALARDRPQQ